MTSDDTSKVIDCNLVRRWKSKVYKEHIPSKLDGLYFDVKLDNTRQSDEVFINEDPITLISEPGTKFLNHIIII